MTLFRTHDSSMPDNGPPSRFAFIMHADVVDSTAMVQQDERLAHERIQGTFRRFGRYIVDYGGTLHEVRGDALVAEFEKASDAVSAALAFQGDTRVDDHPNADSDDAVPRLRIGIAMGEVIIADRTVTGAGAVLAQRLEQIAKGGEVVIQGAACESIPQRLPFAFDSLGDVEVKGFERPVRAFSVRVAADGRVPEPGRRTLLRRGGARVRTGRVALAVAAVVAFTGWILAGWQPWRDPGESMPPAVAEAPAGAPTTLAVLPLVAGSEEQEIVADGFSDHLAATLSRAEGLFVIGRASAFAYKGTSIGAPQVAEELDVRHLVRGSLRRDADRVGVRLQVIDAPSGTTLLDEDFERPWSEVLDLETQLVDRILVTLGRPLSDEQRANVLRRDTDDPVAFDFYLRGRALSFGHTGDETARAREMFLRAIDRDAQFARALAALAMTYVNDVRYGWNDAGQATLAQAREAVSQALAADETLAEAHLAAAHAALLGGNAADALDAAERAIALRPGLADAHAVAAEALSRTGQADAAVERMREAMRINPHPPPFYEMILGRAQYFAGQVDDARRHLQRAVELDPNDLSSRVLLAASLSEHGALPDARRHARQVLSLSPRFNVQSWTADPAIANAGRTRALRDALIQAGLPSGTLELPRNDTGRK